MNRTCFRQQPWPTLAPKYPESAACWMHSEISWLQQSHHSGWAFLNSHRSHNPAIALASCAYHLPAWENRVSLESLHKPATMSKHYMLNVSPRSCSELPNCSSSSGISTWWLQDLLVFSHQEKDMYVAAQDVGHVAAWTCSHQGAWTCCCLLCSGSINGAPITCISSWCSSSCLSPKHDDHAFMWKAVF